MLSSIYTSMFSQMFGKDVPPLTEEYIEQQVNEYFKILEKESTLSSQNRNLTKRCVEKWSGKLININHELKTWEYQ